MSEKIPKAAQSPFPPFQQPFLRKPCKKFGSELQSTLAEKAENTEVAADLPSPSARM